jgi:hypothetical protein
MRGSKARNIRKAVKQLFNLEAQQAIYNEWSPPEFAKLPQGFIKVVKGVPCELISTCGRKKYKELKAMYK